MFTTIRTAALSALVAFGALSAAPVAAQAEGIYLNMGGQDGARIGVQFHGGGQRWQPQPPRHWQPRPWEHRWERDCSPRRAVDKAERMGMRWARVVDSNRRTITVAGRKFDRRMAVTFAKAPNCPVVRW